MNTLAIKIIPVSDKYRNECIVIDDIALHEYLIKWHQETGRGGIPQPIAPAGSLVSVWNTAYHALAASCHPDWRIGEK